MTDRAASVPTDIADIIGDSVGSQQRFLPSQRHPPRSIPPPPHHVRNNIPAPPHFPPPPPPPPPGPAAGPLTRRRPPVRPFPSTQSVVRARNPGGDPAGSFLADNNSIEQFDVLGGGVFRDPPQDFIVEQQRPAPPSFHHRPHTPPTVRGPPVYEPTPRPVFSPYFDDDFFSNFRDFADVNRLRN